MSEEEKQMFNKMIYCNLINGEQALKFNRKYEDLQQKVEQQEKEIDRLNNIINRIDNFVDRTIEIIKQQPSENDEWILERLNGIKYLKELKEENK